MGDQSPPAESHDPRIDAALRDYLERIDRGEMLDPANFVAQHAEIAHELRSLINAEVELRRLASGDAEADRSDTSAGAEASTPADTSTRSFALHGQETIAPQARLKPTDGGTASGLKEQFGRYRIVKVLGQGAMGTVYLAEDTQLKRQVALKTPHFDQDPSGELLERLYREARAAATLRHPNICPVHDVGEIDGTHYISMAYIEGHPLSAFIRSSKPQPERQILIVVRKLAQALQEAHEHKVVHRDLKPANIMVDKRGEPLIMDFGLARHTRPDEDVRLTHSGTLVGTPAYMSPEQVDGDSAKIGPLTDEYSLGVILYELLTGQLPFRGSMMAVLGQIVTKQAAPPSQIRPGLDPRIEAACLKMMAKNPSDRFASLTAVADELATILRNPGDRPTATGKSAGPFTLPAPADVRAAGDAGSSKILKSQTLKTLTGSDLESLEELARKCFSRHDYEQVIQIAERIPEQKCNATLQSLLENARAKADEIAFLICDIDEAVRLEDFRTALKKADALLKIKPGHHRALEVQERFSGEGDGGAVRLGTRQLAKAWSEGGWIPWSALAFGLAVVGVVWGVIVIYLGKTVIVIDAQDPGITVAVNGHEAQIMVPGKQSIKVEPGDGELKISYDGLETVTKSFSLKKGQAKTLTVAVGKKELVAYFQNETAPNAEKKEGAAPGVVNPSKNPEREPLTMTGAGKERRTKKAVVAPPAPRPALLVAPFGDAAAQAARQQWADYLHQPGEITNTIDMKLVLIPPGEFLMGDNTSQRASPRHTVRITRPLYFDAHEVTRGAFARFVSATGYKTEAERDGGRAGGFDSKGNLAEIRDASWKKPGFEQTDSHPVVIVSWNDAAAFCRWLSEQEGETYRLPTEAEWEYACRAGTTTRYISGNNLDGLFSVGNGLGEEFREHFHQKPKRANDIRPRDGYVFTAPVGSFRPNQFGLFDVHGNVWEWCQDWFGANYYAGSPTTDPTGPPQGAQRVSRGGGFDCGLSAQSTTRDSSQPEMRVANLGFRVVREISTPPIAPEQATNTPSQDGYVPLFNGKDLSGWSADPSQQGAWHVDENGLLVGGGPAGASFLYSDRADYKNFRLRIEARLKGDEYSGLWVRTQVPPGDAASKTPTTGYKVELREPADRKSPRTGSIWAVGRRPEGGSSYNGFGRLEPMVQPGRWFTLEIVAEGKQVYALINGESASNTNWFTKDHYDSGRIAIQQHVGKPSIEFRKIEIKFLPDSPVVTLPKVAVRPMDKDALVARFDESQAKAAQQKWADRLKQPVTLKNSIAMQFELLPPGQFEMGSDRSARNVSPAHTVRITRPFYLGTYEVTRGQFAKFVTATHFKTHAEHMPGGWRLDNADKDHLKHEGKKSYTWRKPGFPQDDRHPVVNVCLDDAVQFCNWLSRAEGRTYRLPTEAEWEYACRAGTTTGYYNGDNREDLTRIANVADAKARSTFPAWLALESSDGWTYTSPVGSFAPNGFGLYDTLGNVMEWCSDWYDKDYYKTSPQENPPGAPNGKQRTARGGSFTTIADASARWYKIPDHRFPDVGFRVVCEIAKTTEPAAPIAEAPAPPSRDTRHLWVGQHRFENVSRGKWRETAPGSPTYHFNEVTRTPQYVELFDKTRSKGGCRIRIEDSRVLIIWGGRDKDWRELFRGAWVTNGAEGGSEAGQTSDFSADRRAAESVLALGGKVAIRQGANLLQIEPGTALPASPFRLVGIKLSEKPDVTDATLEPFEGLSELSELDLSKSTALTDAGLAHLEPLTQLKFLSLYETRITDAGLEHLRGLVRLESLWIQQTDVGDAGLAHLRDLAQLRSLLIWGTHVTDAGLVHLEPLQRLEGLMLSGRDIGDSGLAHLKSLKQLKSLWLTETNVTDAGLAQLSGLPQLRDLNLRGSRITDAGVAQLQALKGLKSLGLEGTKVTRDGAEQLKKSLPNCQIRISQKK